MNAVPIQLGGHHLLLEPDGALWWPERRLIAVADLHLEKGSAAAARGRPLPPWDSRATLERLARLLHRHAPARVIALGDTFHDDSGLARMAAGERARLLRLAGAADFIWVRGNHDPAPADLPGASVAEWVEAGIAFRHQGGGATPEICGHHHPKAAIPTRGGRICRPCFVSDGRRLMLPAFGAYTGGLDVRDPAIGRLFPRGMRVFLPGPSRLYAFPLAAAEAPG